MKILIIILCWVTSVFMCLRERSSVSIDNT